ncbi:hypothetical protein C8J57DRAFT_1215828 [Mycena rebaudengoi]|nr:hypothetical protein C8J57DRAFT_1215828 [Mycena rebaudengoi]
MTATSQSYLGRPRASRSSAGLFVPWTLTGTIAATQKIKTPGKIHSENHRSRRYPKAASAGRSRSRVDGNANVDVYPISASSKATSIPMKFTRPVSESGSVRWRPSSPGGPRVSRSPRPTARRMLKGGPRVSGVMISNHTSIGTFFKRMIDQYNKLRKRNAFLEQYKQYDNILGEFDEARPRATCDALQAEYKTCESANYISYGSPNGEQS